MRPRDRLEALEALCGALRAEIEYLRGQVQELAAGGASLPTASAPGAKRRLRSCPSACSSMARRSRPLMAA